MTEQVQKQEKAADGRRPVEEQLSRKSVELKPSGIRRFFDIVSEMKDAISWVSESRILTRRGISVMRASIPLSGGARSTRAMRV